MIKPPLPPTSTAQEHIFLVRRQGVDGGLWPITTLDDFNKHVFIGVTVPVNLHPLKHLVAPTGEEIRRVLGLRRVLRDALPGRDIRSGTTRSRRASS